MKITHISEELLRLIVRAAEARNQLNELNYWVANTPIEYGKNQIDFRDALEQLENLGIVLINDGYLELGSNSSDFERVLLNHDPAAWRIVEIITSENDYLARKFSKFDNTERTEIGRKGELLVIQYLKNSLDPYYHNRINHTSEYDDTAGFDIECPSLVEPSKTIHLEVKTSVRPQDKFIFFLSSNEYRTALKYPNDWYLVLVKMATESNQIKHLKISYFEEWLPKNIDPRSNWESVRVTIENFSTLRSNIP